MLEIGFLTANTEMANRLGLDLLLGLVMSIKDKWKKDSGMDMEFTGMLMKICIKGNGLKANEMGKENLFKLI